MPKTTGLKNYSDLHFTKKEVAKCIIDYFTPSGKMIDPCKGDGVFYNLLDRAESYEITEGKDFFEFNGTVDWIITNPPFSNLTEWLVKSFQVASHVVFLLPISKITSSEPRLKLIMEYGGIREMLYFGSGRNIGFDIGFPFAAIHFEKNYKGPLFFKIAKLNIDKREPS